MTVAYQARNPRFSTQVDAIELEYNHPDYGWIPFSAHANDVEEHGRILYTAALAGQYGEIAGLLPKTSAQLLSEIAAKRYEHETSGIVFEGLDINTERASQGLILGAALEAFMDPSYSLQWKTPTGFVPLTAPVILLVAKTIRAHVQACFDREAELIQAVTAGTYNETMLHLGWPE